MKLSLLTALKKQISIGMLLAFCMTETSHFTPFLEYYINFDYIAEVLCINKDKPETNCQGTCYLKDQIQQTEQNSPKHPNNPIKEWTKTNLLFFEQITKVANLDFFTQHILLKKSYQFSVHENLQIPPTPPPRF
jgi:hypothetical protein